MFKFKRMTFHAGIGQTEADPIVLENIAQMALGSLIAQLTIPQVATRGFDSVQAGSNSYDYIVPTIQGGTVTNRADNGEVTDTNPTISSVTITATEYDYSVPLDINFADSTAGNRVTQIVDEAVRQLAEAIETAHLRELAIFTGAAAADWHVGTNTKVVYEDVQAAKLRQNNLKFPKMDRWAIFSEDAMSNLLNEAEFSEHQVTGVVSAESNAFATGMPNARMQGYRPLSTPLVFNANAYSAPAGTPLLNGAIASTTTTTVAIDGLSPATVTIHPGQSFTVNSEKFVVIVGATAVAGAVSLTCIRGAWASTAATHADNDPVTFTNSYTSLAIDRGSVMHIMPAMETFNDARGTKVGASYEGLNLYIMKEAKQKSNGAWRYIISTRSGIKCIRPAGGVQRIVKSA